MRASWTGCLGLLPAGLLWLATAQAQTAADEPQAQPPASLAAPASVQAQPWQACRQLTDGAARLACYDRWAQAQTPPTPAASVAPTDPVAPIAPVAPGQPMPPAQPALLTTIAPATAQEASATDSPEGCRNPRYSALSRFWELEEGSDCGTFGLRGYRPMDIAFSTASAAPQTPTSPAPGHTGIPRDYQPGEMRLNLSLRTKLAQGLFRRGDPAHKDSLWFGYTQQSTWQLFNANLSRPFRTTDHEPELIYIYPMRTDLPGGWRWRYAGLGLAHQSNGQSLPLSRSWNRVYLMGGIELDDRFHLNARAWQRIPEDARDDDNPDIVRYIGRAEFAGWWNADSRNAVGATLRTFGKGSLRLEWLRVLGPPHGNLRLHAQFFHGYGDTLADYNRSRTVLSLGLSLVDF